ncbi:hypothetical protein IIA79_01935 [bacterium]|nr:hypothetical protein [bacterium]
MASGVLKELAQLERRARTITGIILGALAFATTYGLMLFEGQTQRPGFHFYPLLLAVAFYLAGDLLALIWFRTVTLQISKLIRKSKAEMAADLKRLADEVGEEQNDEEAQATPPK